MPVPSSDDTRIRDGKIALLQGIINDPILPH
jgi:hypothetical protein